MDCERRTRGESTLKERSLVVSVVLTGMGTVVGLGLCSGASYELERERELHMLKWHGGNDTGLILYIDADTDT